jgi:hypothetical protein
MKTEKLSLKGIKNVLSRAELKKVMAGGSGGGNCVGTGGGCCLGFGCLGCCSGGWTYGGLGLPSGYYCS